MRITHVIGGMDGGGAQRVVANLANAWVRAGREVTIVTTSPDRSTYALDPRVAHRTIPCPRPPSARDLRPGSLRTVVRGLVRTGCFNLASQATFIAFLRDTVLDSDPDVVISHMDGTNMRTLAAMTETGVPVIAYEHIDTTLVSIGARQTTRQTLYRQALAVVAPHPVIADWLGARGARAVAIHNPLLAPTLPHAAARGPRKRAVMLNRLDHQKRVDFAIYAFASLAERFPDWDLEIYGYGPLRASLAALIEELELGERVRLCPFDPDSYAILRRADLMLSASSVEGFGNSIWEALACGVPVVALDGGAAVRSLVRDGIDGFVIAPHVLSAFASAMAMLMGDESRLRAMAARAPEVLERFSLQASLEAWDHLLAECS
jgi:GalNAc-alpha-(1->4)-GalNAc-alpha-(1->3)-diNAcBac-PP-undecaprenol alpha-1,4-N-acetyl-D-galactosaminyltransferase